MAREEIKTEHAGTVEDLDILGTVESYPRAVRAQSPVKKEHAKGGDAHEEVKQ